MWYVWFGLTRWISQEGEILSKLFIDPISTLNPFVILPLIGQLILIATLFQKMPSKTLSYLSIGCLGILLAFMFVIGLMSLNFKIIISTIPFIAVSIIVIRHYRKIEPKLSLGDPNGNDF